MDAKATKENDGFGERTNAKARDGENTVTSEGEGDARRDARAPRRASDERGDANDALANGRRGGRDDGARPRERDDGARPRESARTGKTVFQFSAIPPKSPTTSGRRGGARRERPRAMSELNERFVIGERVGVRDDDTAPMDVVVETETASPEATGGTASPEPMAAETPATPASSASSTIFEDIMPSRLNFNIGQGGKSVSGGSKKSAAFTRRASVRLEVDAPTPIVLDTPDSTVNDANGSFGRSPPISPVHEVPTPKQFTFNAPPPEPRKSPVKAAPRDIEVQLGQFSIGLESRTTPKIRKSFNMQKRAGIKTDKKASVAVESQRSAIFDIPDMKQLSLEVPSSSKKTASLEDPSSLKQRGNTLFREGRYAEAEELYGRAIMQIAALAQTKVARQSPLGVEIDPFLGRDAAVLLTNRAAARMMIDCRDTVTYGENMLRALTDCEHAMRADASYARARTRASACHMKMAKFQSALDILESKPAKGDVDVERALIDAKACIEHWSILQSAFSKLRACTTLGMPRLYEDARARDLDAHLKQLVQSLSTLSRLVPTMGFVKDVGEMFVEAKAWVMVACGAYLEADDFVREIVAASSQLWPADRAPPPWLDKVKFIATFGRGDAEGACKTAKSLPSDSIDADFRAWIDMAETMVQNKEEGNRLFNAKQYADAVTAYTKAFDAATSPVGSAYASTILGNRAAASQGLSEMLDSLADAGRALAFNPWNVKALSRRSTIYELLRCWDDAVQDMQTYIEMAKDEKYAVFASIEERKNAVATAMERLRGLEAKARLPNRPQIDAYEVLGLGALKSKATDADIKKAYRALALKYHPDKANRKMPAWAPATALHDDADRLFKLLGEMNAQLSDAALRRVYDETERLREFQRSSPAFARSNAWSANDFQYGPENFSPYTSPRRAARRPQYTKASATNNYYWSF